MADISNLISEEALAEWFRETYEQASPDSVEGRAYREASDKKAFRQRAINHQKDFLRNIEEKREQLNRLLKEADEEAGENSSEEEKDKIFKNKLFEPENDFIFDAIHPDFLTEEYNVLGDEISLAENNQQALPLIITRAKIRDRMDQLITNLGDDLVMDETLVAMYPEDAEGLVNGYQDMIETRRNELEYEVEEAEDDADRAKFQEKLDVIIKIQEAMEEEEQKADFEDEATTELDWTEKELQSWNHWCIDEHTPPYPAVYQNEDVEEGLKFDIYTNETDLENQENKAATIHYHSENQASIEMEEDKTPEFEIFDKLVANIKANDAPGVTFDDNENMTDEFKCRLAAACLNNDMEMDGAPDFIDKKFLETGPHNPSIYDNAELMRKIDEYNNRHNINEHDRDQAAMESEKTDTQKYEEMLAREYRMTHFKEPDESTKEGQEDYANYELAVAKSYEKAREQQDDLTLADFMEARWAKMVERMEPQADGLFLGGKPIRKEDMLKDFEEHEKNHTEHESMFALALKDSLERSNKEVSVFDRFEDATFYAGELVKGTDTPFIRGTRDVNKLNDYEKQYISEENFDRFSKTARIFCGKMDDFFTDEPKTVEEYDEQFKLYRSDHTKGWLARAQASKTNPETAWQRLEALSPKKNIPQRGKQNDGAGR